MPLPLASTARLGNALTKVTPPEAAIGGRAGALQVVFDGRAPVEPSGDGSLGAGMAGVVVGTGVAFVGLASSPVPQLTIQPVTKQAPSASRDVTRKAGVRFTGTSSGT